MFLDSRYTIMMLREIRQMSIFFGESFIYPAVDRTAMTEKKIVQSQKSATQSKGVPLSISSILAFLSITLNDEFGVKIVTPKGTFIQGQTKEAVLHNNIVRFLKGTVLKYYGDTKKSKIFESFDNPIFIKNYLIPDVSTINADSLYTFINHDADKMKSKHLALPHVGRTISMSAKIRQIFKTVNVKTVEDLNKWLGQWSFDAKSLNKNTDTRGVFPPGFITAVMPLVHIYNATPDFGFGMSNQQFKHWKRFYPNSIDENGKIKGGVPNLNDEAYQGNSFNPDLPQLGTYKEQVEMNYGKDSATTKRFLIWGLLEGSFIELPEVAELITIDGDIQKTIKQAEQKAKKQAELDASVEAFKKEQADKMGL